MKWEPEYQKSTDEIKVAVEQVVSNNNIEVEQGEEPITIKEWTMQSILD